jgi:hypothetical protein
MNHQSARFEPHREGQIGLVARVLANHDFEIDAARMGCRDPFIVMGAIDLIRQIKPGDLPVGLTSNSLATPVSPMTNDLVEMLLSSAPLHRRISSRYDLLRKADRGANNHH